MDHKKFLSIQTGAMNDFTLAMQMQQMPWAFAQMGVNSIVWLVPAGMLQEFCNNVGWDGITSCEPIFML